MNLNEFASIKSGICVTCLSSDRKLFPIDEMKQHLTMFCNSLQLSTAHDKLCWECRATLIKLVSFRRKATRAQTVLADILHKRTYDIPKQSLTNLRSTTSTVIYCIASGGLFVAQNKSDTGSHSEETVEHVDFIKTEPVFEEVKVEHEDDDVMSHELELVPISVEEIDNASNKDAKGDKQGKTKVTKTDMITSEFRVKTLAEGELQLLREKMRRSVKFKNSTFKCERCIETYTSQELLDEHNKRHEIHSNFSCKICEQKFPSETQLEEHSIAHYSCYQCTSCGFQTYELTSVRQHIYTKHKFRTRHCNECDQDLTTLQAYKNHRRTAHGKRYECAECGAAFSTATSLKRHFLKHSGMPQVECNICHKKYRGKWGLQSHMRTHDDKLDERAYCAECDSQFKNMLLYRLHLKNNLKHNPDLKHQCSQCDKRFVSRSYLKCHTDSMHNKSKNYICHICSQAFQTTIRLRVHVREKHEGKTKPKNKVCEICAKAFNSKATLQQHINSHTGARPYACKVCGATFSYSGALYTHNKLLHINRARRPCSST